MKISLFIQIDASIVTFSAGVAEKIGWAKIEGVSKKMVAKVTRDVTSMIGKKVVVKLCHFCLYDTIRTKMLLESSRNFENGVTPRHLTLGASSTSNWSWERKNCSDYVYTC